MLFPSLVSLSGAFVLLLSLLSFHVETSAATNWITYTNSDGETLYLDPNRQPALYTNDFGDCQGDSVITLDSFYAAYYKDNMTISFGFGGSTAVANESVIMSISVYAYGESRFSMTFDPCYANILSMCPINASVPILGNGVIPISAAEVAGIPDIALSIPDFEGQAIIRIFGNSTQSQIACYSAVLVNGNSFSHPVAIGTTVGIFVAIAFISSVATAIYGSGLQETRKHYAHSLSMFVVFSVLQHVFFTGALSTNFPPVLVAFWSNFGWASGMIYSKSMQNSITQFVGNQGNISSLGTTPTGQTAVDLGGGYSLSSIYKRSFEKRAVENSTTRPVWAGHTVEAGLPLPGNFSSFAGTLAELQIPASNAFLTGLIWFLVLLAIMVGTVIVTKIVFEGLAATKLLKTDRFAFFRKHWIYCAGIIILRACYIGFFMLLFLSLFQFTVGGATGSLAIAGIVFCIFLLAMLGLSAYALWYRLSGQEFRNEPDHLQLKSGFGMTRESAFFEREDTRRTLVSLPWRHLHFIDPLARPHVHDDEDYLIKFGWLSARFRRSKWWFFAGWLIYEFVRACFYGAAAGSPLTQIFGLLVWEILAFFTIMFMRPFESNRLNMLMVYFLGFSKIASVALCSAFDPRFGLGRILTTVIGVIIIVIQGVLIICMMVAVVIGAISSWMSVRRHEEHFRPKSLIKRRAKYFAHIEQKATDKPQPKPQRIKKTNLPEEPTEPYFAVTDVRRQTKIEEENSKDMVDYDDDETGIAMDVIKQTPNRSSSRAPSITSRTSISNLPYGARRHRASWSTRDFSNAGYDPEQIPSGMHSRISIESIRDPGRDVVGTPSRNRATSLRQSWTPLVGVADADSEVPPVPSTTHHQARKSTSQSQFQSRHFAGDEQYGERPSTGFQ